MTFTKSQVHPFQRPYTKVMSVNPWLMLGWRIVPFPRPRYCYYFKRLQQRFFIHREDAFVPCYCWSEYHNQSALFLCTRVKRRYQTLPLWLRLSNDEEERYDTTSREFKTCGAKTCLFLLREKVHKANQSWKTRENTYLDWSWYSHQWSCSFIISYYHLWLFK